MECYFAETGLPSDITEVMVEQHDGKVYIDSSVDISEYLGLSSTSEGISLESEEWEPFTLTYSLSTNNWSLSPENAGALYYDALGNRLKDNSSEENNTDNGGAPVRASEGRETAPADSGDTTASSSSGDEIFLKYQDYVNTNGVDVEYGCKFVDIDGDGTPELITDYGAQFQNLHYIGSDGEVYSAWGLRYYKPNTGGLVFMSESGSLHFTSLVDGCIAEGFMIEVYESWDGSDNYYVRYYYSNGDDYHEILEEEYREYQDDCVDYTEVSASNASNEKTLEDAWEAYNN